MPAINAAVSEAPAVNLAKAGTSTQILVLSNRADLISGGDAQTEWGAVMATAGVLAGAASGYVLMRVARSTFEDMQTPSALPVAASVFVLLAAAVVASVLPAARAARVDVTEALRSE